MKEGKGTGNEVPMHFITVKRSSLVSHNPGHGMCMRTQMKYSGDMASLSAHDIQEYVTKAVPNIYISHLDHILVSSQIPYLF